VLLLAIAVPAVTLTLGAVALRWLRTDAALSNATNTLLGALALARSEALTRLAPVALCPRDGHRAGHCTGAADWSAGVLLFIDADRDGQRGATETVLREIAFPAGLKVRGSTAAVHFDALRGIVRGADWRLCAPGTEQRGRQVRLLPLGQRQRTATACP
jgi:type IV fimbrial biogenesis protein FimT